MTGRYLLEVLVLDGWVVRYDGDDPIAYAREVLTASTAGNTTRVTCIGTKEMRPL